MIISLIIMVATMVVFVFKIEDMGIKTFYILFVIFVISGLSVVINALKILISMPY